MKEKKNSSFFSLGVFLKYRWNMSESQSLGSFQKWNKTPFWLIYYSYRHVPPIPSSSFIVFSFFLLFFIKAFLSFGTNLKQKKSTVGESNNNNIKMQWKNKGKWKTKAVKMRTNNGIIWNFDTISFVLASIFVSRPFASLLHTTSEIFSFISLAETVYDFVFIVKF